MQIPKWSVITINIIWSDTPTNIMGLGVRGVNGFWPLTNEFFFTVSYDCTNSYFMLQLLPPLKLSPQIWKWFSKFSFYLVVILIQLYPDCLVKVNCIKLSQGWITPIDIEHDRLSIPFTVSFIISLSYYFSVCFYDGPEIMPSVLKLCCKHFRVTMLPIASQCRHCKPHSSSSFYIKHLQSLWHNM